MSITVKWNRKKFHLQFPLPIELVINQEIDPGSWPSFFTLHDLKKKCSEKTGVPIKRMKLLMSGATMKDDKATLDSYGVQTGSKILMLGSVPRPPQSMEENSNETSVDMEDHEFNGNNRHRNNEDPNYHRNNKNFNTYRDNNNEHGHNYNNRNKHGTDNYNSRHNNSYGRNHPGNFHGNNGAENNNFYHNNNNGNRRNNNHTYFDEDNEDPYNTRGNNQGGNSSSSNRTTEPRSNSDTSSPSATNTGTPTTPSATTSPETSGSFVNLQKLAVDQKQREKEAIKKLVKEQPLSFLENCLKNAKTDLEPLVDDYVKMVDQHPPGQPMTKALEQGYLRASELLMQNLLNVDQVMAGQNEEIRLQRKKAVKLIQGLIDVVDQKKTELNQKIKS